MNDAKTKIMKGAKTKIKGLPVALPPRKLYASREDWLEAAWQKIAKSENLLASLVSPYERRNIVMRAAIVDALNSGKRIRETARELQLSLQTVNAVKKTLGEKLYKSYWERSKLERHKRVYSSDHHKIKPRPRRQYFRTKYGKVYIP